MARVRIVFAVAMEVSVWFFIKRTRLCPLSLCTHDNMTMKVDFFYDAVIRLLLVEAITWCFRSAEAVVNAICCHFA